MTSHPCDRIDQLLSAFLEEETSPAETRFVEGHLTACRRCREQRDELALLLRRVSLLPRATVSEGFTERVLDEALGRRPAGLEEPLVPMPARRLERYGLPLAAAAVLALAAFVGVRGLDAPAPGGDAPPSARLAIDEREGQTPGTAGTPAAALPAASSLDEQDPVFGAVDTGNPAAGLGLASDAYVLEDWALRRPAGGGDAVLTRVDTGTGDKVVVSF